MRLGSTLRSGLAVAVVAATLVVGGASGASADPYRCGASGSDPRAWCTTVKSSVVNLNVRSGPGTSYPVVGTLHGGQRIEVDCWKTGTVVNGVSAWTKVYNFGYVSDYYLNTGLVRNFLDEC